MFNRKCIVVMDVVMTLFVPTKVLDFYDLTLSTVERLHHLIR